MSFKATNIEDVLAAEIRRFVRLYPASKLPGKIVEYVTEGWEPKTDADLRREKEEGGPMRPEKHLLIRDKVCKYYGVGFEYIIGRGRQRERVHIRRVLMYMLCKQTDMSLVRIAEFMKPPKSKPYDHTSVIHHREIMKDKLQKDKDLRAEIRAIRQVKIDQNI